MHSKSFIIGLLVFSASGLAEEYSDRIQVTAQQPTYQRALSKVLPQTQVLDETRFSSDSLASLLSQSPAVNLNGQGGLFQTLNIRGFARWRIQTLVEGIPIYSERRAGTAVEFLPPDFVGQAFLTQGAASTQLGSGAMGGGLDLSLATPEHNELALGYGLRQDFHNVLFSGQEASDALGGKVFWQLNHRQASNSEDGAGKPIQDRFEHNSLSLRWQGNGGLLRESLLVYSNANNIAKASADPVEERFTLYPENIHLMGKIQFDWHNASVYFHDANLSTVITRPGQRVNALKNDALDVGAQLNNKVSVGDWLIHWRSGVDARTGVKAFEIERDTSGQEVFALNTLDARQWASYLSADFTKVQGQGTWVGGNRIEVQYQQDSQADRSEWDTNVSGFAGYQYRINQDWLVSGYLSSAYRVPSLTERFFDGSTPRGSVSGDPDLDTEKAWNLDLSLSYQGEQLGASLSLFGQRVQDYIELLRLDEQRRHYRNLDRAEIKGINYQAQYEHDWHHVHWKVQVSGQWLDGEDQSGNAIADIAPAQHRFTVSMAKDDLTAFVALNHRMSSDEMVEGELPVPSVTTVEAGLNWQLSSDLGGSVNLSNVTDKLYVTSRDDLAPFAKGRDVNLSLRYRL